MNTYAICYITHNDDRPLQRIQAMAIGYFEPNTVGFFIWAELIAVAVLQPGMCVRQV